MNDIENIKEKISGLFTNAASTYDRVGFRFFSYFGNRLVDLIGVPKKAKVLDIAAGRGASLFPAAKKVGPQGLVIGIDIAPGMVQETTTDLIKGGFSNAKMVLMDAEDLNFPDNTFDIILCGFSIFFFPQYEIALSEALRVLKPGGRIGLTTFGRKEYNELKWYEDLVQKYLPPKEEEYKPEKDPEKSKSPEFDTPEGMQNILTQTGFREVHITLEEKEYVYKNAEEFWLEIWSHGFRATLEQIPSANLLNFKEDLFKNFQAHSLDDGFHLTEKVLFTIATK